MKSRLRFTQLFLALLVISLPALSQGATLTLSGGSGNPGNTVSISLAVDTPTIIAGAAFTLTYDTANLTLTDVQSAFFDTFAHQWTEQALPNPHPPTTVSVGGETYDQPLLVNPATGGMMIAAARVQQGATNATLFNFTFQINNSAPVTDYTVNLVPSVISNSDAGYSSPTAIPILVGGSLNADLTAAFPAIPVTSVTPGVITINPSLLGDEMTVSFGSLGLWHYDNNGIWQQISDGNAQWLGKFNGQLVCDFGNSGVWSFNGTEWNMISDGNPDNTGNTMVEYNGNLYVDFGAMGLWFFNGTSWQLFVDVNPEYLGTYNNKLVVDFGVGYGLYEFDGIDWNLLSLIDADNTGNTMITFNNDLIVDFGAAGLHYFNGTAWQELSPANSDWLGSYGDKIVSDFGIFGFYEWNGSSWTLLTPADADNTGNTMTTYQNGIAVDFGAFGLWYYSITGWQQLTTANAESMGVYLDKLVVDFGSYGLYEWNGTQWTLLTDANGDNSGNTMMDVNLF